MITLPVTLCVPGILPSILINFTVGDDTSVLRYDYHYLQCFKTLLFTTIMICDALILRSINLLVCSVTIVVPDI